MNFTQKTLTTLEFDKICEMLADCAPTAGAQSLARKLTPSSDAIEVLRRQRRTTDARKLLETKGMPPFGTVIDVSDACERAVKGAVLSMREILDVGRLLRSARQLANMQKPIARLKPHSTRFFRVCFLTVTWRIAFRAPLSPRI